MRYYGDAFQREDGLHPSNLTVRAQSVIRWIEKNWLSCPALTDWGAPTKEFLSIGKKSIMDARNSGKVTAREILRWVYSWNRLMF